MEGRIARLNLPGVLLAIDADCPAAGLTQITIAGRPWIGGSLLGAAAAVDRATTMLLTDWHVQGENLAAVYETNLPEAARLDLAWRAIRPASDPWLACVELVVSVRTERLDWRHAVRLESVLPEGAELETPGLMEGIFTGQGWSLAVMVHPADLDRRELTAQRRLLHWLFQAESLEKGVMLRGRARAWFLPPGLEIAAVAPYCTEFLAADPPLSTQ